MKNIITIFTLSFFTCFQLLAQQNDCDCENRYQTELFNDVNVQTVTYSDVHNLSMDIYTPSGDNCINRPLLIFAHGGTFIFGNKSNPTMVDLCESFAKKGYVTASINYRLAVDIVGWIQQFTFYTDTESAYEVVLNATMDGKAAIRYFRKDAAENNNTYGIDVNQIWGGGNSAGGILFLHAAHIQSKEEFIAPLDANRASIAENIISSFTDGIEGDSGNPGYSSDLAGVISLAGALHRSEYLDANDVPTVFCHGDDDSVVPYNCNGFQNNPSYDQLCGGGALYSELSGLDVNTDLQTFPGSDHCPWDGSPVIKQQMKDFVTDFLYNNINCNQTYLNESSLEKRLLYQTDIMGRINPFKPEGLVFNIYTDGSVMKQYQLKQ